MPHAVEKIVMAEESERVESYSSITKNIFPLTQGLQPPTWQCSDLLWDNPINKVQRRFDQEVLLNQETN